MLQSVEHIDYSARFPFAKLVYSDSEMPFTLELTAWTPFIPHDVKNSSLPVAYFDFSAVSKTAKKVSVMLMISARNTVGYDTFDKFYKTEVRTAHDSLSISMSCGGMDEAASNFGQIAISSLAKDSTYYAGWNYIHPYYEYVVRHDSLPNVDTTDGVASAERPRPDWMPKDDSRNVVDAATGKRKVKLGEYDPDSRLFSTIAQSFELNGKGSSLEHTFVYNWNFPNLYCDDGFRKTGKVIEGH